MGKYPGVPGNSCLGRELISRYPSDSKLSPLQPISNRAASNWQAKWSPTKAAGTQTSRLGWGREGIRLWARRHPGFGPGCCHGDSQSIFTSGQQSRSSEREVCWGGWGARGTGVSPSNRNPQRRHGHFHREQCLLPGGGQARWGAVGLERLVGLREREVATEPAKRPLESLEGFLGRKDLQLC